MRDQDSHSENPHPQDGQWVLGMDEIKNEVMQSYRGHHQYDWVRPRKTWLEATCPVYIDFGDEHLVRLETYPQYNPISCIRLISKKKFMYDAQNEFASKDIGINFFPIT